MNKQSSKIFVYNLINIQFYKDYEKGNFTKESIKTYLDLFEKIGSIVETQIIDEDTFYIIEIKDLEGKFFNKVKYYKINKDKYNNFFISEVERKESLKVCVEYV